MAKSRTKKNKSKDIKENMILFLMPFLLYSVCTFLFTAVVLIIDINKSYNFPVMLAISAFCCFVSAYLSSHKKRQNGLVTGIIYNAPTIVILLLISVIINLFKLDPNILISASVMIAFSCLGGIFGVNSKMKPKRGSK